MIDIREPMSKDEEDVVHEHIARGREAARELSEEDSLTAEDRTALRRLIRRGRKAEEELLAGTCGLVKQRINALGFAFDRDELEGAGLEGLVKALREFDAMRTVRFATYANYWISKMVFEAISHRVPYPDSDLRLVIKLRRLQHQSPDRSVSTSDVMKHLKIPRAQASRIMKMSADVAAGMEELNDESASPRESGESWPESEWVIDVLHDILGDDFTDFWMWTGRVMSLEELGRAHGISKQAMSKRVTKWRRLVETSPHADRMIAWLRAQ